ncbi:MAG: RNA 2',3'-cyclic phosphodiesterase [Acidobacteria bacterium]|nr:RNA 2',3'-cyclic phosphodiesterase [Acidobacteriota bacterium]
MRTFVAIEIPGEIRDRIQKLMETLRRAPANVRWSRPESLHITLKFLGEIPAEKVGQVKKRLQALPAAAPVTIRLAGAGFFPNDRTPRVIWLGIEAGPELHRLAASVEQNLLSLGIPKEDRNFSPHLTLGRIRAADGVATLRTILQQQEPLEMGTFTAAEFFLYESQLAPGGSIYRKVARFPLGAPAAEVD